MRTVKDLIAELQKYDSSTQLDKVTQVQLVYKIRRFYIIGTKDFGREVYEYVYTDNLDKHIYEQKLKMSQSDKRRKEDVRLLTKNIKEAENAKSVIIIKNL